VFSLTFVFHLVDLPLMSVVLECCNCT